MELQLEVSLNSKIDQSSERKISSIGELFIYNPLKIHKAKCHFKEIFKPGLALK